ncbi:F0F1 ATP synthase subunit epsilon [bacterium]|nr:F0F1 ATP synthase subunit epsilon [bacterium]
MEKKILLELVTPERHVAAEEVDALVCPGLEGSFGVLPGHLPLVAALKPGMLKVQRGAEEIIYAIGGGYAEVSANKTMILADTAELAEDIDIEAARKEKERALAQMKKGLHGAEMEGVEVSLKKALARLSVANVVRRRKGS